jgi:hypothetical protein
MTLTSAATGPPEDWARVLRNQFAMDYFFPN